MERVDRNIVQYKGKSVSMVACQDINPPETSNELVSPFDLNKATAFLESLPLRHITRMRFSLEVSPTVELPKYSKISLNRLSSFAKGIFMDGFNETISY